MVMFLFVAVLKQHASWFNSRWKYRAWLK